MIDEFDEGELIHLELLTRFVTDSIRQDQIVIAEKLYFKLGVITGKLAKIKEEK